MKSRRRPYVRTLIVGSALAVTGCAQEEVTVNPYPPPEEDVLISYNPPMDPPIDADAGPAEDAQGPGPELPPIAENPAPEPEE